MSEGFRYPGLTHWLVFTPPAMMGREGRFCRGPVGMDWGKFEVEEAFEFNIDGRGAASVCGAGDDAAPKADWDFPNRGFADAESGATPLLANAAL